MENKLKWIPPLIALGMMIPTGLQAEEKSKLGYMAIKFHERQDQKENNEYFKVDKEDDGTTWRNFKTKKDRVVKKKRKQRRVYSVKSGENLETIAKKAYGNPDMWRLIFRANRNLTDDPSKNVKMGQLLILPDVKSD